MILSIFKPQKLCLHEKVGHTLYCSKTPRGTHLGVQNSASHNLRGPKHHEAKIEGKFAQRRFGPLNLRAAYFWTPQSVPRVVLEQCTMF